MKLKKIASLLLAGVMAVSMLAGCSTKTEDDTQSGTVIVPVVGVASTVNGELNANKKKISFTENTILTNLLTNYYEENPINSEAWGGGHANLQSVGDVKLWDAVCALYDMKSWNNIGNVSTYSLTAPGTKTYCNIYWVNNDFVTKEDALRMVGQAADNFDLPKEGETENAAKADLDYTYTGTVAAIEAESKGGTESVWVIAVTVTQTATNK